MNLSAFILAAGLGERLRPITDHIPKPLLPVLGKPVLQYVLEKVSVLPVNKIAINLHHKKELIEQWIKESNFKEKMELFPENIMLGTGGALKNAESLLRKGIFIVHNSDVISDINLEELISFHISSNNLVTLVVHDYPEFNNLVIDEKGLLKGILKTHLHPDHSPSTGGRGLGGGGIRIFAFTGIAVYSPEFLKVLPVGASCVVDAWLKAISAGYKIGTMDVSGCYWRDIGTPVSYAKAVIEELRKNGETVYMDPSIEGCKGVEINGYVVIEKDCILGEEVSLRNCILGPGFKIQLNESEIFGFHKLEDSYHANNLLAEGYDVTNAVLIGTGGSDRKYFRVKKNSETAVLMQSMPDDPDFECHIQYTQFFKNHSIPVPDLFEVDRENKYGIFEDLGDLTLYSWLKCQREREEIENIYRKVIDILVLIHTKATIFISECPILQSRIFDYEHLRWETSYFIDRFIKGVKNIEIKNSFALNEEFHRLAVKVDSFPKTVIHRDFQSQNIMIAKGERPSILDYQGARVGPPAYDVVSILWDPYYRIEDEMRERLLDYYINKIHNFYKDKNNPLTPAFSNTILSCRLQRHMQALGAYGFLSIVKSKKYFQKYMPEGMRLLKEDIKYLEEEYPGLFKLIINL
ncbi:MAG: phosphotransferase [Nitrospirae bacterium]|nr:phosphotransferase [Nitrospirota bacterium]